MPCFSPSFRGPFAVMGVGTSLAIMGTIPLAITMGTGVRSSATVIGMGFIGFGLILFIGGLCWCFTVKRRSTYYDVRHREQQESLHNEHDNRYEDPSHTDV